MKNSNTLLEQVADLGVSCCLHTRLERKRVVMMVELDAETKQYLVMNFKVSIFGVDGFMYEQEVINCEKTYIGNMSLSPLDETVFGIVDAYDFVYFSLEDLEFELNELTKI
jgi:hypothetical protein